MTVKVLEMLRSQENFDLFWDNVLSKSKPLNVDDPKLPRQRGAPKRLEDFHGYGPAKPTTYETCLLYTSPSPRDKRQSRMPSSA